MFSRVLLCLAAAALLAAPAAHAQCLHLIGGGETLDSISKDYDTTVDELVAINPQIEDPETIIEGDAIFLPCKASEKGTNLLDLLYSRNDTRIALLAAYAAGLEDTLQSLDSDATLFLPTDEAFAALLEKLDVNATTLLSDKKLLKSVLRFHLVPDTAAKAEDLEDGQRLVTDLGKRLTVIKGPDGVSLKTPGGVIVKVSEADVPAGKAVAHIISEVLIPDEAPAGAPTAAPGPKAGATATKDAPCDYKLKDGDTLAELAKDFGLTVDAIVALNKNITNPDKIVAGDTIILKDC